MNILEGLLWSTGILAGLFAIGGIFYWIAKPLIDDDKANKSNTTLAEDETNTRKAGISSIKRGCLRFVIMIALMLDSCDGKFLT
jgi:hypothetical protein